MKRIVTLAALALSVTITGWIAPASTAAGQKTSGPVSAVVKGQKLFNQYCATCHGITGKGEEPVAAGLEVGTPRPTANQNPGEKFPFNRVQNKIDGEKEVTAHGPSRMPVWGQVFRKTSSELQRHADVWATIGK